MIEKIDTTKIRGIWQESTGFPHTRVSGGDDTIKSIQLCADKINEIIQTINELGNIVDEFTGSAPDFRKETK